MEEFYGLDLMDSFICAGWGVGVVLCVLHLYFCLVVCSVCTVGLLDSNI